MNARSRVRFGSWQFRTRDFAPEKALGCGALTDRQVAPGDQQGLS